MATSNDFNPTEEEVKRAKDFLWQYLEPSSRELVVYKSNPENIKADLPPLESVGVWLHITLGLKYYGSPAADYINRISSPLDEKSELV